MVRTQVLRSLTTLSKNLIKGYAVVVLFLAAKTSVATEIQEVDSQNQLTSVNRLLDVQSTDWTFQALLSLVERYGCTADYRDNPYQGDRTLGRFEFAVELNACLNSIDQRITTDATTIRQDDWQILQRLQQEYATELATLRNRVEFLEAHTTRLEASQFSPTTKLEGQVIIAANAGGYTSDRIIDPTGAEITDSQPNATVLYRVLLDLNTSFSGQDLLKLRLDTVSAAGNDNISGFLEPNFGSVLEFSVRGTPNQQVGAARVYYSFTPSQDVRVSIGPVISVTDYVDLNYYANGVNNFATLALVNNYILFPADVPAAGAAIEWSPNQGAFKLRGVYLSTDAANPATRSQGAVLTLAALLYPTGTGKGGLFGNPNQGVVELEYSPSKAFALRLLYSSGNLFGSSFDAVGANVEWRVSQQIALFGRYGYGSYRNTVFGDLNPHYWMAGVAFPDLFKRGALAGVAVGQPFIEHSTGNATQINFEAFYNVPITDNIQIAPIVQVITHPSNQEANGTIVTGTIRTIFSF